MKNPLRKRLPRELKSEFGKYFVIFFLMFATIGLVSGYLVAGNSMVAAYDETFEKYNIEDGNLRLAKKANKALIKELENNEITLYDNFYVDDAMENSTTLRIFANRTEVNTVCLMDGVMPTAYDEIGLDRMYAVNNNITIGDTLSDGTNTFRVTGLIALPDYSCLFQDNNDSMFDAQKFGVSIVTAESFARFSESDLTWSYSWKYDAPPADDAEANDMAEDLMKSIAAETELKSFRPPLSEPGDCLHRRRYGRRPGHGSCPSLYCYDHHGVRLRHHDQQHDPEGSECHRNTACLRLHKDGADPPLYDAAASRIWRRRSPRKYPGLHLDEGFLRFSLLCQLQLDHFPCTLERERLLTDNYNPPDHDDSHHLPGPYPEALTVPVKVPPQGFQS